MEDSLEVSVKDNGFKNCQVFNLNYEYALHCCIKASIVGGISETISRLKHISINACKYGGITFIYIEVLKSQIILSCNIFDAE